MLERKTFIDSIEINRDGILHVRFGRTFLDTEDNQEMTKRYYRFALYPGDNINARLTEAAAALNVTKDVMPPTGELTMLRNVANTVWTPAVITRWNEKKAQLDALAAS